jgi:RNA polymerase sigma factor (sigma-70 family)
MGEKSKFYMLYKFNDGTAYKVEVGKDEVTETDMRYLRRLNKGRIKKEPEAVSLDAIISGEDKHLVLVDEGVDVALIVETADEYASLHRAIDKLLPQQQELIMKRYFKRMSLREIAKEEGVFESAIRDRLNRIHVKLKKYLKNILS